MSSAQNTVAMAIYSPGNGCSMVLGRRYIMTVRFSGLIIIRPNVFAHYFRSLLDLALYGFACYDCNIPKASI